jgi:hypothetical protein
VKEKKKKEEMKVKKKMKEEKSEIGFDCFGQHRSTPKAVKT